MTAKKKVPAEDGANKAPKKTAPKKTDPKKAVKKSTDATKETKATVTASAAGPKPAPALARKQAGVRVELLDNWMALNTEAKDMTESECLALITAEREGRCRPNVILRLHGRYNKVRGARERTEFMQPIGKRK
jgi:hypothetical protein